MADDAATRAGQDANILGLEQVRALYAAAQAEIAALRQREVTLAEEAARDRAALAEAHEQQMATADVMRVIASSSTDLQGVLDTITKCAVRLCEGDTGIIQEVRGDLMHGLAAYGEPMVRVLERIRQGD